MQREAVHLPHGDVLHQHVGPVVILAVGATGDALDAVRVAGDVVFDEGVIALVIVGVEGGRHVAAATPALVADGEIADLPRLVAAMGAAEVGQGRVGVARHVFDPLHRLLHGAAADVEANVRLDAEQLAEIEKLVRAEVIVFHDAAPVGVDHRRAFFAGSDAVAPVVLIGEAAARPAELRHLERFQGGHHVVAITPGVRDGRALPHPDAFVDAAAEVLGEMAVDVLVDHRPGLGGVEDQRGAVAVRFSGANRGHGREGKSNQGKTRD